MCRANFYGFTNQIFDACVFRVTNIEIGGPSEEVNSDFPSVFDLQAATPASLLQTPTGRSENIRFLLELADLLLRG